MNAEQAFQQALSVSKRFIEESLLGGGVVAGKNVIIQGITPIDGGNRITFSYTLDNGMQQTSILDVMDGIDGDKGDKGDKGNGIEKIEKTGSEGLTDIYTIYTTDGKRYDMKVINGKDGIQGIRGERGERGMQGIQGVQGIQGEKGDDGYPFLIYKEYSSLSEFNTSDFPEIGLMFMVKEDDGTGFPIYRYAGEQENSYSYITSLSGSEAIKGDKGDRGDKGEQGIPGKDGIDGTTYMPKIGEVKTVSNKEMASVNVVVDDKNLDATFNFSIPEGDTGPKGEKGDDGDTPNIGENNHWYISGQDTGIDARGIKGDRGEKGEKGDKGEDGESIEAIRIDSENNVYVKFTNGLEKNIGKINVDISADFLTSDGFGKLRYYNNRFQYMDSNTNQWVDAVLTPDNTLVVEITPQPMRFILSTYDKKLNRCKLRWREPNDTIIDNQALCIVEKVVIRRKQGFVPENKNDGELVVEINRKDFGAYENEWFIDTLLNPEIGERYFYKAFPVGTSGVYSNLPENETSVLIKDYVLYGFVLNQNESDPESMIMYCEDNTYFKSAYMNYQLDIFDYGDWKEAWFIEKLKPCMLNYDGTVAYELDPNDYRKKFDGTNSDIADPNFPGNAMVGVPKIYWKIIDNEDDTATIYISNKKIDDSFVCWSHIDNNGKEIDYCYVSMYDGTVLDGKLRSISGLTPTNYISMSDAINYALANNTNKTIWNARVYCDYILFILLLMLIGKSTDSQNVFGLGCCSGRNSIGSWPSGTMNDKGLFWGSNIESEGRGVKVFGIENFWGNIAKLTAGYINALGTVKIKMTHGQSDGSTVDGYNNTGDGYIEIQKASMGNWTDSFIGKMLFSQYGIFVVGLGGSATTYFTDIVYNINSAISPAFIGSYYEGGFGAGMFCVAFSNNTGYHIGSSICCKPLAEMGDEV